ncbi:MAG: sulfurtransferase [Rhodospirillaceae bacterium]|nr:MAG: sulfurtransferase [Rhodospirillaceae bacterium]
MDPHNTDALVTTGWLAEHMGHPGLRIVDASYFVPGGVAPARDQFLDAHIPGAQFFDINAVADSSNPKEHAFPSADVFAARVGELGIGNGHRVIAYDHMGGACAAARVWFLFRAFGHPQVSVLSGGRSAWLAEKRPVETGAAPAAKRQRFQASKPLAEIRRRADMEDNIRQKAFQVLDARAAGRFAGTAPEPRPGMRGGHIPGSQNLPFLDLFDQSTMTFKPPAQLRAIFAAAGVDLNGPLTTTCGSGISACALALGAYLIGKIDVQIYDGSWLEWGSDASLPIETGNARS